MGLLMIIFILILIAFASLIRHTNPIDNNEGEIDREKVKKVKSNSSKILNLGIGMFFYTIASLIESIFKSIFYIFIVLFIFYWFL